MPPSKGKIIKKKGGEYRGYTNPPFPDFSSKTKQKTLKESIHDPKNYTPLQGSPQEEIELLKILFPCTHKAYDKQNSQNKCIQKYISEETHKSHIPALYNDDMHYKDKYLAVYDLIKCFFKDASTNPTLKNPPILANQEHYMWKKEISDKLS